MKLSEDINEAIEQIKGFKLQTRPDNWIIPKTTALTCHQAYIQFCYRMSKFDAEFAQPDTVVGQSWLNSAMTRLIHEFETRLIKNATDKGAQMVFNQYLEDVSLRLNGSTAGRKVYQLDSMSHKMYPEVPSVKVNLVSNIPVPISVNVGWWPKETNFGNWDFVPIWIDAIEIDDTERRRVNFLTTNSFTCIEDGVKSKVLFHREPGGREITFWYGNLLKSIQNNAGGRIPMSDATYNLRIDIESVTQRCYNFEQLMEDSFIDTSDTSKLLPLPVEFHNDLIDYAIDAYFESMFFHQFGKYSMKQGRQDSDAQPASTSRTQKLDAVPPQRYKLNP